MKLWLDDGIELSADIGYLFLRLEVLIPFKMFEELYPLKLWILWCSVCLNLGKLFRSSRLLDAPVVMYSETLFLLLSTTD